MDQNRPTPAEDLTPRDIDVLNLVAEGLSNPEIAERLVLATSTVKWYVRQLYSKLQIDDTLPPRQRRRQMADKARQLGLGGDTPAVPADPKHNLPAQTTAFIGREQALSDLSQRLSDRNHRLITLIAPGGMGKTRLALEAARQQLSNTSFANGVYFVPLQALSSAEQLVTAIGEHSGFQFMNDERIPKQQLLDYLRHKQLLLVLDNFEHLLEGAALVSDVLSAAPEVQVLATSRERLNLRSETVYSISGMFFGDAQQSEAAQLFIQAAQQVRQDFELTQANRVVVHHICQLVEGMPLAIILAAAWVDVLPLAEIAEELSRSIDILAAEMRDVPQRHWSIRAVFEPTWRRLLPAERAVFMKFAVFRGGCTHEAAEAITGVTLPQLQSLINKALVTRSATDRYELHELLRQFAETKLTESGEASKTLDSYKYWYTDFMKRHEDDIKGGRQREALDKIEADFENIRKAWLHAAEQRDYDSIQRAEFGLDLFIDCRKDRRIAWPLYHLTRQYLQPAPGEAPPQVWGQLILTYPFDYSTVTYQEQAERIKPLADKSLEIANMYGDHFGAARALRWLGRVHGMKNDYNTAIRFFEKSIAVSESMDDEWSVAATLLPLGYCWFYQDNLETAAACWRQSVAINRELENKWIGQEALQNLGALAFWNGDYKSSNQYHYQFLTNAQTIKNWTAMKTGYLNLAFNYFLLGEFDTTVDFIHRTAQIQTNLGTHDIDEQKDIVAILNEDFEDAYQTCQDMRQVYLRDPQRYDQELGSLNWRFALAALGMEDFTTAYTCILAGIRFLGNWQQTPTIGAKNIYLPLVAVLLAWEDSHRKAAQILGLAETHPASATGWLQLPLMVAFRDNLQTQLGTNAFATAWEQGSNLDLDAVITDLLNRWGGSSAG